MVASNRNNIASSKMERLPEIVFFDIETTVPNRAGPGHERRFWVLEFGAIVVCPLKLVETDSYCTLIRPGDLSVVALKPTRANGITRQAVLKAPTFDQVADKIYQILHGRIWSGHNIQRFDCLRIKEAFAEIGRLAPEPIGIIDSLGVLSDKFGRRAGDMKMATLANYFGLGEQKHRSLDDVRMNLEVLKSCATVLLLESSLPSVLSDNWRNDDRKGEEHFVQSPNQPIHQQPDQAFSFNPPVITTHTVRRMQRQVINSCTDSFVPFSIS
ncbi:hypothetical protein KSS87_000890 [Heliosperma pusillum]|nr:hypothetical protein KSS87_000890 [Heliosperma pusillum]